MKKIYTSYDNLIVNHLKNILESHHISCMIKNDYLAGAAGELPPTECWPELWIAHNTDYDTATSILKTYLAAETTTPSTWVCSRCGEVSEDPFTACWQCGENRYR